MTVSGNQKNIKWFLINAFIKYFKWSSLWKLIMKIEKLNCSYNFKWHNMRQNFQIINHLLVLLWVCPTGIKVKHCSYIINITLAFTYIFFLCYKWFTFKSFCQFHKGTHILAFIFSSNPPNHLQALELLNSWWVVSLFLWHFHFTIDQLIIMII